MRVQVHRFSVPNCCNKNLESIHEVNKQKINITSINQSNGNSIRWLILSVAAWKIQAARLKICGSYLTCKFASKCLNVREQTEVIKRNKRWSPPFPCCLVSRQCQWKKNPDRKKIPRMSCNGFKILQREKNFITHDRSFNTTLCIQLYPIKRAKGSHQLNL